MPSELAPNSAQKVLPQFNLELIEALDVYLVEDVRTARRFLRSCGIKKPIEGIEFHVLDKKTDSAGLDQIFKKIGQKDVGVLSEAGCPGVADPGALAVAWAHRHNWKVCPLIGPSSILLALMGSGLNGQSFTFEGYLPIEKAARVKAIKRLESQSLNRNQTQIFIETPYRNNQLLADLIKQCAPHTQLCIASNLTDENEFLLTKKIKDWSGKTPELHKIPTIFLMHQK